MHNAVMCTLSLYGVIRITRHLHIKLKPFINSLFHIEMIAKLEWTQSNAQQNIEQL